MDWSSLISGLVGVLAGGLLTWFLTRQQWKRDQRTRVMEQFYTMANRYVIAFDPTMGDRPRPKVYVPELAAALTVMAIYAPLDAVLSAARLIDRFREDHDDDYPLEAWTSDDSAVVYPDYVNALSNFEAEMRKALGLRAR